MPGFRGWIDELRVVSGEPGPERLCNWAGGTLRGLEAGESPAAFEAAGVYPQGAHDEIRALPGAGGWARYRCERERGAAHPCLDEWHAFARSTPSCVGPDLLFPQGPLVHDRPRPDARANPACHSCHAPGHPTPGLRVKGPLAAGAAGSALADDRRRQPSQAPRRLHGFVPAELLGLPVDHEAPPEGLLLDPLLYPAAAGDG